MNTSPIQFDYAVVPQWHAWQTTPWGRLFYRLARFNLERHLDGRPLRILDIGGGNGADTVYYAAQGHQVTLLDVSPALLAEAGQAIAAQGLAERVHLLQGEANAVCALLPGAQFDLILCHLMISFVSAPMQLLNDFGGLLAPQGLVSVIEGNRYSEAYRIAFQKDDLPAAQAAIGMQAYDHPWFPGRPVPMFSAQEVIDALQAGGCTLAGNYGIRCICDYLPNGRKTDPEYLAALEQLERQLSNTDPYPRLARFYHVIGRRAG